MADQSSEENVVNRSVMDNITEKFRGHHSFSSSSDDVERTSITSSFNRLSGRHKSVHSLIGIRKAADLVLWRSKQVFASFLVGATVLWILFEGVEYPLLTFVCRVLILSLAILFIGINSAAFLKSVCSGSAGSAAGSCITTADSSADRMEVDEKPELFWAKGGYKERIDWLVHLEQHWKELYGSSTPEEVMEQAYCRLSGNPVKVTVSAGEGILDL